MTGMVMVTRGGSCGGGRAVKTKGSVREDPNQISLVDVLLAALRKSMVYCRVDRREDLISSVHHMEIGWPTNVQHIAHVTFDRFNGFLGLPVEFEVEIPSSVPSASASVFGVSAESMQCSSDSKGNSVPTILLLMQDRLYRQGGLKAEGIFRINPENSQEEQVRDKLNRGIIPENIDVHCLAGLIKAWFRELPSGVLDGLSPEQVLQCNTEEASVKLVKQLKPTEASLLNWAVELMADVVEEEESNKMNARNIAMVFAPNMTQMSDPLTALMHAVQVMNLLKTLIMKTLREREDTASGGYSPMSSCSSDQQMDEDSETQQDVNTSDDESRGPKSDIEDDDIHYNHSSEEGEEEEGSLDEIEECFLRQLDETQNETCRPSEQQEGDLEEDSSPRSCSGFNIDSSISFTDSKNGNSCLSTSDGEDSGMSLQEEGHNVHKEIISIASKNSIDILMDDKMRESVSSTPFVVASSGSV